jgi:hypothetical protein
MALQPIAEQGMVNMHRPRPVQNYFTTTFS